jgi:hypothetical protein
MRSNKRWLGKAIPFPADSATLLVTMRYWITILFSAGLFVALVGCEHTVTEPGEPEHGGVFLHASPDADKPPTTRRFLFF